MRRLVSEKARKREGLVKIVNQVICAICEKDYNSRLALPSGNAVFV